MRFALVFVLAIVAPMVVAQDLPVTEKLMQTAGVPLETYIGGQVFKVTRSSPLPNLFGRADIFGRTVDRGSVELRYRGQTQDGKVVFRIIDIDTRSNETTMNRTQIGVVTGTESATFNLGTNTVSGVGTAISVKGQEGRNEMLPPNTTEFAIDPTKKSEVKFGSVTVKILGADETLFKYSLSVETKPQ